MKQRISNLSTIPNLQCKFSGGADASHLFFSSSNTAKIWRRLLQKIEIPLQPGDREQELCIVQSYIGRSLNPILYRLLWSSYIYVNWSERTQRIFKNKRANDDHTRDKILDFVRCRAIMLPRLDHWLDASSFATLLQLRDLL